VHLLPRGRRPLKNQFARGHFTRWNCPSPSRCLPEARSRSNPQNSDEVTANPPHLIYYPTRVTWLALLLRGLFDPQVHQMWEHPRSPDDCDLQTQALSDQCAPSKVVRIRTCPAESGEKRKFKKCHARLKGRPCAVVAALYVLASPNFNLNSLAWIACVPLIHVTLMNRKKRGFWRGWIAGTLTYAGILIGSCGRFSTTAIKQSISSGVSSCDAWFRLIRSLLGMTWTAFLSLTNGKGC